MDGGACVSHGSRRGQLGLMHRAAAAGTHVCHDGAFRDVVGDWRGGFLPRLMLLAATVCARAGGRRVCMEVGQAGFQAGSWEACWGPGL